MRNENEEWGGTLAVTIERVSADKYFCRLHPEAEERDYWLLAVKDSGVGMDEKTITKIFNPFFTTKETEQGTGLGLSMVYSTVKQHNGFIDVYSDKGVGSTFNTYLPVLEKEAAAGEVAQKKKSIPTGDGLILVVDDEEIMCDMARDILKECGYKTISAENGKEGIEVFKKRRKEITAVLLDMSMPKMSGKETYIKMKEIQPDVRVLLASGFRLDERVDQVLKLGVKEFIQKPFTLEKLARAIDRVVNTKD
jgi:CheY-like chemotaxis protein